MPPRPSLGTVFCLALWVGGFLSGNAAAATPPHYTTWTLEYSGKHTLVWYYANREGYLQNQPKWVVVDGVELAIYPDVRPPTSNSIYLLEYSKVHEGEEVLDIGTGSGLHALFAAEKAKRVVATDIVANAVANASFNATRLGVEKKIEFRVGDLFEPLKADEKFDVIFFNINFPFAHDPGDRTSLHERFFAEVRRYMKPGARLYFQTGFLKNFPRIYDMLHRNHLRIMEMHAEYLPKYRHEPMFMMIQSVETPQ